MTCEKTREMLPAYHDGELATDEAAIVRSHLESCRLCREEERFFIATWKMLGESKPIEPSSDFEARFWARVQREKIAAPAWKRWLPIPDLKTLFTGAVLSVLISIVTGTVLYHKTAETSVTEQGIAVFTSPHGLNSLAITLMESK